MKQLLKKFETIMTAVAFAESGEFETARQIVREELPKKGAPEPRKDLGRRIMRTG